MNSVIVDAGARASENHFCSNGRLTLLSLCSHIDVGVIIFKWPFVNTVFSKCIAVCIFQDTFQHRCDGVQDVNVPVRVTP